MIEGAVYLNAAINAFDLTREATNIGAANLAIMYGVCDLRSVAVRAMPPRGATSGIPTPSLALAPRNHEAFAQLAREVAQEVAASGILA